MHKKKSCRQNRRQLFFMHLFTGIQRPAASGGRYVECPLLDLLDDFEQTIKDHDINGQLEEILQDACGQNNGDGLAVQQAHPHIMQNQADHYSGDNLH